MWNRGDVVLVAFPHSNLTSYTQRPALIVQDLTIPTGLSQVVLALITSSLNRTGRTRVRVDRGSPEGRSMNLLTDSVIVADNLQTVEDFAILRKLGICPVMDKVSAALRLTLGL